MAGLLKAAKCLCSIPNLLTNNSVASPFGLVARYAHLLAVAPHTASSYNKNPSLVTTKLYKPSILPLRNTSFFTKLPAEDIWKGVTSVSNPGKKRGRGKGVKGRQQNLNRGQIIGIGEKNMVWPGLNSPIVQGKELVKQRVLPDNPDYKANLVKMRDTRSSFKFTRLSPLERGWSGGKMPGRKVGPPDPVGEDDFQGFETIILEFKTVCNMKGNLGRTRRVSAFVITGNGNGLAGFAQGKALVGTTALRKAKNRAAQKLMYIERYNEHTVLHDFFTQFGKTKIFVEKKPEGYGLVCHRAIREICQAVGIKDIYAKVEGSTKNVQHVTKAFIIGLLNQKTYDKIAEETKLNVVEFRKEQGDFPVVLAKPSVSRKTKTIQDADLNLFINKGKVANKKRKLLKFYQKQPSWLVHLSKTERFRNRDQVAIRLLAEHGEVRSFLVDRYPECRRSSLNIRKEEDS